MPKIPSVGEEKLEVPLELYYTGVYAVKMDGVYRWDGKAWRKEH